MPLFYATVYLVVGAIILYAALLRFWISFRKKSYPPGPPQTSLISGSASMIPATRPWLTYTKWAQEQYGSIMHYRAFNQHAIVLSSMEDCVELFERRSNLYSDRPKITMVDLMGWDINIGLMPYGPRWLSHRRLFHQAFTRNASVAYWPTQTRKVTDFLYGLLTSPDYFRNHIRTVNAAIIMSVTYGYDISPKGDYFVTLAEDAVARLAQSWISGAVAVNAFPFLRFLPSWFPGAGFQKYGAETREIIRQMVNIPFKYVEDKMAVGDAPSSLVADQLPNCKSEKEYAILREFASISYAGQLLKSLQRGRGNHAFRQAGADTSSSSLATFFYAMVIHPEVQEKAQHEIDLVVGTDRLPTYDDRSSLPYIEAILREVLRWRPVVPLSVPRASTADDVYKGYFIPKGATIIPNIWALAHDPEKYQSPELFNPGRFFDLNGDLNQDDVEYIFGFGRRICPGRYMASATIWLVIATVLSTFNISKKRDASGKEIPINEEFTDGVVSHPLPHVCSIIPRSDEARQVIMKTVSQTRDDEY